MHNSSKRSNLRFETTRKVLIRYFNSCEKLKFLISAYYCACIDYKNSMKLQFLTNKSTKFYLVPSRRDRMKKC